MSNTVTVDCSGCMRPVKVDVDHGTVVAQVPSNGKRGSLHVPAHPVQGDAVIDSDDTLVMWDCPWPGCGYADSTYATPALRKAMA